MTTHSAVTQYVQGVMENGKDSLILPGEAVSWDKQGKRQEGVSTVMCKCSDGQSLETEHTT